MPSAQRPPARPRARAFSPASTGTATACSLRRHEDAWRGFFFHIGRQPLQLYYEYIAGDLEDCVGRVVNELHLERPPGPLQIPARMSRQSDDLSESWVQNYLEDVSRR